MQQALNSRTLHPIELRTVATFALQVVMGDRMQIEFDGPIWFWKGPAPWYFVRVPTEQSHTIKALSGLLTYGWGVIPVRVQIGATSWTTSLIPKDGHYLVPIRANVRTAEQLVEGATVTVQISLGSAD